MKKITKIIMGVFLAIGVTSCELFGLDFQSGDDYEPKQDSNKINQTVWDFIQSRPDIFSTLIDGIRYAGIEDLYKVSGNTYILLTNTALSEGNNSYWTRNPVKVPGKTDPVTASAWEQYDVKTVKELLTYHILKGEWSYHNLNSTANWVETYGEGACTLEKNGQTLQGDTAVMDVRLGQDRNLPLQLNNYDWNFRGELAASNGSCRTTNIHAIDGYIHVSDYYQPRPTRYFMSQN